MKIVYGLLCLYLIVLFHEAGHFLWAKLFKVKVENFSVGFGPVLFHRLFKGTDYRFSLIPLGGYCTMKGEKEFMTAVQNDLPVIKADKDSLYGVHPLKRALIGFGGPLFNVILASFFFLIISLIGYSYYSYSNKIKIDLSLFPNGSIAYDAGIRTGDIIKAIDNEPITNFSDLLMEVSSRGDRDIKVTVDRDGRELIFNLHTALDKKTGGGKIGINADTESLSKYEMPRYSFFPAIANSWKETFKSISLTIRGLQTLFKGVDVKESVSGPARVISMLGEVVEESSKDSIRSLVVNASSFMAYISISLFIMNLLPFPVLDGGLILFALIEAITHKKLSPKFLYYIQFVGFAFIIFVLIIGLSGDISYFMKRL